MEPPIPPLLASILFFVGMWISLEVGWQFGVNRRSKESEGERNSLGIIEGALFAMFGLVLAFSFSGAASRFNEKRMLIAEEVNTIETAYLRVQLLSPVAQPELRDLFREYVDSRVATYRKLPDMMAAEKEMSRYKELQHEIWTKSVAASLRHDSHPDAGKLLLPALNNMIDISTTRTMALRIHPPRVIFVLLFALGLICSVLAGYRIASGHHRSWVHIVGFTAMTVIIVFVILDVEYPRAGLIRIESPDQLLLNVRDRLN
jgi:hypothetical protein